MAWAKRRLRDFLLWGARWRTRAVEKLTEQPDERW